MKSSFSRVARVAAVLLAVCGTLTFAQAAPALSAGALVTSVDLSSPAKKAGIATGDVILVVGDTTVNSYADILRALELRKPRDVVEVEVQKGDMVWWVSVTLAASIDDTGLVTPYLGVSDAQPAAAGMANLAASPANGAM